MVWLEYDQPLNEQSPMVCENNIKVIEPPSLVADFPFKLLILSFR